MKPEFILYALICLIGVTSYKAFGDPLFKAKWMLRPTLVRSDNEYWRLFTSGFIHADWMHLGMNLYVMYGFGKTLTWVFPKIYGPAWPLFFIGLFVFGVFFANVTTSVRYRLNPSYASLGASGGVSSILFAFITMFPKQEIGLIMLPMIPGFFFGVLYLIYCQYMQKRGGDNINHGAHFWGAIFGVLFVLITQPNTVDMYRVYINSFLR